MFKLLLNIQRNISQNKNIFLNILFGETNISISSQILMQIFKWIFIWIFIVNIFMNIQITSDQGNAPGMDKEVWRKSETRLEWWGWGLKVWKPLHVLRRDGKHVGWTWLVGSARAMTAAALHFRGRCRGGAPSATRAAQLVNTLFFLT